MKRRRKRKEKRRRRTRRRLAGAALRPQFVGPELVPFGRVAYVQDSVPVECE